MKTRISAMLVVAALIIIVPLHVNAKPLRIAVISDPHYAVDAPDKGMKMLASGKQLCLEMGSGCLLPVHE